MKQKKTDLKISKKKEMTIEKYISKKMKLMNGLLVLIVISMKLVVNQMIKIIH